MWDMLLSGFLSLAWVSAINDSNTYYFGVFEFGKVPTITTVAQRHQHRLLTGARCGRHIFIEVTTVAKRPGTDLFEGVVGSRLGVVREI